MKFNEIQTELFSEAWNFKFLIPNFTKIYRVKQAVLNTVCLRSVFSFLSI